MLEKLKASIHEKTEKTVFSESKNMILEFWRKSTLNKCILIAGIIGTFFLSMFVTGKVILGFANLSGAEHDNTLRNVFAAWLTSGVIASIVIWLLMLYVIFKVTLLFRVDYHRDERGFDVNDEHTYGTADMMTPERMRERFVVGPIETNKSTIFGRDPHAEDQIVGQKNKLLKINRNVFMVAGPSAGKSATFVLPLLLQIIRRGESAIISDPKSELFKYISELAKALGYEVRILNLNPMFLRNSDPCNFLMYVGQDVDKAQVVANAIINTTTSAVEAQNFWNDGALNLLQALILRITVGNDFTPEEKNLPQLFTYITTHDLDSMEADFEYLPDDHPAKAPFKIFKDGDDVPKKQVLQGLGMKLKLFNSPSLKRILSESVGGLDILNPGRKKCLYFIGSNDQDASMASVVSLFYTLEYQELVRYADMRQDGELPVTVHMVLDEYANMAPIPTFERKLSTVRSRNIVTYIIVQDINQLKTKHPNDTYKTVLNDCDYFMCLKTNDVDTMKWFEEMSGEQTKTVKNKGYVKAKTDLIDIHNEEHINQGTGQGYTMTEHQIRTLKDNEVLLVMSLENIVKLHTFFWKDHPYARFIKPETEILPAEHYPFWRLIEDGVVNKDFDYDHMPSYKIVNPKDDKLEIDKDYDPDALLGVQPAPVAAASGIKKGLRALVHKEAPIATATQQPQRDFNIEVKDIQVKRNDGKSFTQSNSPLTHPDPEQIIKAKNKDKSNYKNSNKGGKSERNKDRGSDGLPSISPEHDNSSSPLDDILGDIDEI